MDADQTVIASNDAVLRSQTPAVVADIARVLDIESAYVIAYRVLRNRDDAAEAVQESAYKFYCSNTPDGMKSTTAFFDTIVRNTAIDMLRRRRAKPALPYGLAAVDPTPAERAIREEEKRLLHEAIEELPEEDRRVRRLWLNGLSPAAIAQRLGKRPNAVHQALHRSLHALGSALRSRG